MDNLAKARAGLEAVVSSLVAGVGKLSKAAQAALAAGVAAAVAVIMIGAIPVLLIMAAITGTVTVDTDDIRRRYRTATRPDDIDVEVIRDGDAEEDN
jgi:hypothetical protein